jgi:hypothetical protein
MRGSRGIFLKYPYKVRRTFAAIITRKKSSRPIFQPKRQKATPTSYEAGNAECSVHDLSSECSKESSLIKISESCDHTKNDGGTNEAKKHKAHDVFVVP